MPTMYQLARSILFAPGNQPEIIKKMPRANADVAIPCLEDGTPEAAKTEARGLVSDALGELRRGGWQGRMFLRVNHPTSEWFADDVACCLDGGFDGVVLPKVSHASEIDELNAVVPQERRLPVIIGIETGLGVINLREILDLGGSGVAVYFGAEDYATSISGMRSETNVEVLYARSRVALFAKSYNLGAFDHGVLAVADDERFRRECLEARGLGYTGKICVHPRQVELANEHFRPTSAEVAWNKRLLAEYRKSLERGVATPAIDGAMIDGPLVKRAEAILRLADSAGAAIG